MPVISDTQEIEVGESRSKISPRQKLKTYLKAGRQGLMPVILATQEAEIGRIEVRSQSGQTVLKTLS
jgi:hypothetical protein